MLAPDNTLEAYRTALAYGADYLEVDVRRTKDGVFVALHDATVGRTTGTKGTPEDRPIGDLTLAEVKRLNVANYGDFALSAPPNPKQTYNPARIPTLDEALQLAREAGVGLDLDLKEDVVGFEPLAANQVAEYPDVFGRSFFEVYPNAVNQMRTVQPDVSVMFNLQGPEPPGFLYGLTQPPYSYRLFGSNLDEFTPERIAEIHDGCGLAVPHTYNTKEGEPEALREGRRRGIDGAKTNDPEYLAEAYGRPVATRIDVTLVDGHLEACLRNAVNGYGLPYKTLVVEGFAPVMTLREGCVALPSAVPPDAELAFAGDSAARASAGRGSGLGRASPCADRAKPRSTLTRRRLLPRRREVLLAGTAFDIGCGGGGGVTGRAGGVEKVEVWLRRRAAGRCRSLRPNGRLTPPRACARRIWLPATGTSSWRLRRAARLPRGRYVANVRAIDVSGNVEPLRNLSRVVLRAR